MWRNNLSVLMASVVVSFLFCGEVTAQTIPADKLPTFAVPKISKAPTIDGKMDKDEWREALATSGVTNEANNILVMRPTTFYLAWDADNIYLACRTWIPSNYKPVASGRSQGTANTGDDGLELHLQPLGKNVPAGRADSSYKFLVNALGYDGDIVRVSVGQMFRNWQPKFRTAASVTPAKSGPAGGRWVEIEMAASTKDFELTGPNKAGDTWHMMLGSNHYPMWMQARIPNSSGYFDPGGYCRITLVENTPAVQVTMDDLPGPCNGVAAVKISAYNPTDKAVTLKGLVEIANVKEEPTLTIQPGKSGEFTLNKKIDANLSKSPGTIYYRVTQDGKELYKYFAYFNTGMGVGSGGGEPPEMFPVDVTVNPLRSTMRISGDSYYLKDPAVAKALRYRVFKNGQDKPIAEGTIDKVVTFYFRKIVNLPALTEGEYRVETALLDKDGKDIKQAASTFKKLDESKAFAAWWNNKLGNIERVIPPFTAMTHKDNVVTAWGRSYKLDALGLPEGIDSQKEPVLAQSARIVAVINGKEERIPLAGELKYTDDKAWRVAFEGQAKGAGVVFTSKGWVEQDGLVYIELTYAPEGKDPVTVDALRVEFPFLADQAESLVCIGPGGNFSTRTTQVLPTNKQGRLWGTLDLGRAGSLMTQGSFFPMVWLGSERRGMMWWADNDKGWVPDNDVSAHEIFREGKTVVLRNNIIGKSYKLEAPRTVTFGYIASPFKPQTKNWRRTVASWDGTFSCGTDIEGIGFKVRKDPKTGAVTDGWDWLCPPSNDPKEWSAIWAQYKAHADAKVNNLLWTDPQGARNGPFVHTSLACSGYGWKTSDGNVTSYFLAEWGDREGYVPSNIDYYLYLADRAFTEGGLRTIYWDIFFPIEHYTVQNDLAYELPDGRMQPGYAGFNTRRYMMRMYSLMDEHGLTPGSQVTHATNAYLLIAAPWVDAMLDGEFHKLTDESTMDWVDGYPLERMRAMSTADTWGTTISWMDHININNPQRSALTSRGLRDYTRLFDSWAGPSNGNPPENVVEFGLTDARTQYVPCWRNPYVTTGDKDILVSAWKLPDRVILNVFNYSKTAKDATIRLDLAKLGLTGALGGVDLMVPPSDAATKYDLSEGTITLPRLAGHTGRVIGIRSTDKAALKKAATAAASAQLVKLIDPTAPGGEVSANLLDYGMVTPKTRFLGAGQLPEVTCQDEAIRVSAWRLDDRVMLVVHNSAKEMKTATLKIDLDKLGLMPKVAWQEFISAKGGILDLRNKTILVQNIPAGGGQIVLIRKY